MLWASYVASLHRLSLHGLKGEECIRTTRAGWIGFRAIALNLQDVTCCLLCSHRQRPVLRPPHLKQSRKVKYVMVVDSGALLHRIETANLRIEKRVLNE